MISLISVDLAASIPIIAAISQMLFVVVRAVSTPGILKTLPRLEPDVWIIHSESFFTIVIFLISLI